MGSQCRWYGNSRDNPSEFIQLADENGNNGKSRAATYILEQSKKRVAALRFLSQDLQWFVIDDVVKGGKSKSSLADNGKGLRFSGVVSTDVGGFCSCQTTEDSGPLQA